MIPPTDENQSPRESCAQALRERVVAQGDYPRRYIARPGQGPPRRFSAMSWVLSVHGYADQFDREVPEAMWTAKDWDGDPASLVAIIACPCGGEPEVGQLATTICNCGRAFLLAGDRIRVASIRAAAQPG